MIFAASIAQQHTTTMISTAKRALNARLIARSINLSKGIFLGRKAFYLVDRVPEHGVAGYLFPNERRLNLVICRHTINTKQVYRCFLVLVRDIRTVQSIFHTNALCYYLCLTCTIQTNAYHLAREDSHLRHLSVACGFRS